MSNSRMKVTLIAINNGVGGTEKRFANLFSYLHKNSHHSYSLVLPTGLFDDLCKQGMLDAQQNGIIELFSQFPFSLYGRLNPSKTKLKGLLRSLSFLWQHELTSSTMRRHFESSDVVHWASTGASYLASSLPIHRPMVMEVQDATLRSLGSRVIRKGLESEHVIFNCASQRIANALVAKATKSFEDSRLFVSPGSFIDYDKTKIASKKKAIAFVGRLEPIKNPLIFMDAIRLLAGMRTDFTVRILGSGSLDTKIDREIAKDNLLKEIVQRYFHPHPEEILSESLVFVSLQDHDNFHSQALLEAMACGCAVVATDVGETHRLVTDEIGLRVGCDAMEIADKLNFLLDNYDTACRMGRLGREKVIREQNISTYSSYLENLYVQAYERFNSVVRKS